MMGFVIIILMVGVVAFGVALFAFLSQDEYGGPSIVEGELTTPPPPPPRPPVYDTFPPHGMSRMEFLRYYDRMYNPIGRLMQSLERNRARNAPPEERPEPDFGYGSAELLNDPTRDAPPTYNEAIKRANIQS